MYNKIPATAGPGATHGFARSRTVPTVVMPFLSRVFALIVLAASMSGCASIPTSEQYENTVAFLGPAGGGGASRDARGEFRRVFCAVAEEAQSKIETDDDCQEYLWRLTDERVSDPIDVLPPLDTALRVFIVGGAFSDCFGDASVAYGKAVAHLAAGGARITIVPISGRSSAYLNASRIAESYAEADPSDGELVVLIGYSKGTVDILHFLARYPATSRTVDAVVSVSGPVHGSEAARRGAWLYDALLANSFAGMCDPGDGGVVDSLVSEYAQQWLEENELPEYISYYTLSAFTTRQHMARGLAPAYRMLARLDPRNDGQVTVEEGLVPGSVLLGYANSDHWGLAIDIEDELQFFAARPDERRFPREILIEAILRFVSDDLGAAAGPTLPFDEASRSNPELTR